MEITVMCFADRWNQGKLIHREIYLKDIKRDYNIICLYSINITGILFHQKANYIFELL